MISDNMAKFLLEKYNETKRVELEDFINFVKMVDVMKDYIFELESLTAFHQDHIRLLSEKIDAINHLMSKSKKKA